MVCDWDGRIRHDSHVSGSESVQVIMWSSEKGNMKSVGEKRNKAEGKRRGVEIWMCKFDISIGLRDGNGHYAIRDMKKEDENLLAIILKWGAESMAVWL